MSKSGRRPKFGSEELEALRELVRAQPSSTLEELRRAMRERTGVEAHEATVRKALRALGFERRRGKPAGGGEARGEGAGAPRRYGYTAAHREQAPEQAYPSSLTDAEWALVADLFENGGGRGLPPRWPRRAVLEACLYVVRTGCSWRELPKGFPHWQNVYRTFRRWSAQGKFEQMHDRLRARWREREGRQARPTAAVLDAQSTRHSPQGGPSGFDAGKKVKGRKRHVLVDTLGLVLAVSVTAASVQDRDGAHPVMAAGMGKYPSVETVFVDGGYAGRCAQTIEQQQGIKVDVVRHPGSGTVGRWCEADQPDLFTAPATADGFTVLPKRWVVERTHAWLERARRLVMHHDRRTDVSEAWVWLAEARMLLRRLTRVA